ncbi:MAG TPA: hypothetical protein DCR43_03925 [Bacteroidales bacterium]|nr:MAG: hypothetical protein A2X11_00620 [Bacteroidetes bacterium GWE2_42_24]OFY27529.1 MAG: hypothetical protein A2X09_07605 [Bacteroidetes bacterium GWF2_43_11]HAQ64991.1 hypothetical protein [Bacteroidales bacterium]HBZ66052.1 hypothetical protein [Bacteroidales bacterium]
MKCDIKTCPIFGIDLKSGEKRKEQICFRVRVKNSWYLIGMAGQLKVTFRASFPRGINSWHRQIIGSVFIVSGWIRVWENLSGTLSANLQGDLQHVLPGQQVSLKNHAY